MSVFKEKIDALSSGKFKKPHKYIALLSMIFVLKKQGFQENKILFDNEFKGFFSFIFNKVAKENDRNRPHTPFYHLKSSGLVTLIPRDGHDLAAISTIGSPGELNHYVAYATLVPELFASLKDPRLQTEIIDEIKSQLYEYQHAGKIPLGKASPLASPSSSMYSFLRYLNTLQCINGGNENALAEFQAQNPLFAHIAVVHPLEDDLVKALREGKQGIILTGHAGDGKTTLAFAVYRRLCGLAYNQVAPELGQSRITFSIDGHEALLIKDLSEQERRHDAALMTDLMESGKRSLLVSNTGALREFFVSQVRDSTKKAEVESALLESLSKEQDDFFFEGRSFKIYNLALRDNLPLAEQVFEKMLTPKLWEACEQCTRQSHCPVHFNRTLLSDKKAPARQRLFLAYRRLQAYGVRLTMRQLTEHLSYCLTGGLEETRLCKAQMLPSVESRHHFYNLFFGGDGTIPEAAVSEMAAIRAVQEQKLGCHPLPCLDKKLWHVLAGDLEELGLPSQTHTIFQRHTKAGATQQEPFSSAAGRLQARRLLYFCAAPPDTSLRSRLQEEFLRSPGILVYENLPLTQRNKRHLLDCLFHVLQEHFTGMHLPTTLTQNRQNTLYITLNRPTPLLRQSVQVVLCAVSWAENFDLTCPQSGTKLFLEGRRNLRDITPLELSIPFLDYVLQRHEGRVSMLPRATFGQQLDTLKAQIIRCMREGDEQQSLRMLRYCSDFSLVQDEYIEGKDTLEVIRGIR
jgi:non-specific serine/threonine protein kinase